MGREAFSRLERALRSMPPGEVAVPNWDCALSTIAAFNAVDFLRAQGRQEELERLPEHLFARGQVDDLEALAWCTWWLHSRSQTVTALSSEVRVDPTLMVRGAEVRGRMLRVLDYHFADDRSMQVELADIRSGSGYVDMAGDLTRLDGHYGSHGAALAVDQRHYDPADAETAREIANAILAALRASTQAKNETIDLRNRAWTQLTALYANLKAASDFVFRGDPQHVAMFPPLRAAVLSMRPRSRRAPAEPAVDEGAVLTPAPAVSVTNGAAPVSTANRAGPSSMANGH